MSFSYLVTIIVQPEINLNRKKDIPEIYRINLT